MSLRDFYAEVAGAAPTGAGLLASVEAGIVRRRRRRSDAAAAGLALAVAAAIVAYPRPHHRSLPVGPPRPDPSVTASPQPPSTPTVALVAAPAQAFPYTAPSWPHGDLTGVVQVGTLLGVDGRWMEWQPDSPGATSRAILVFASSRKPGVDGGTPSTRTVHGRSAEVHVGAPLDWYKNDGTSGTTISWSPRSGTWVTLVLVASYGSTVSAATAAARAADIVAAPHPVTLEFTPTRMPAGMHVAAADFGSTTIVADDPRDPTVVTVKDINESGLPEPVTDSVTLVTVGHLPIEIDVHGTVRFDMDLFAGGITVA